MSGVSNYFAYSAYFGPVVGPTGPEGPEGPEGEAGAVGPTGPSGSGGVGPSVDFDEQEAGSSTQKVICRADTQQVFSGAWFKSHGPDDISANNTNTFQVQILIFDDEGTQVGASVAQGSLTLTGDETMTPLIEGAAKPNAELSIPLTGANITIPAGHTATAAFVPVGSGVLIMACTVGLTP